MAVGRIRASGRGRMKNRLYRTCSAKDKKARRKIAASERQRNETLCECIRVEMMVFLLQAESVLRRGVLCVDKIRVFVLD